MELVPDPHADRRIAEAFAAVPPCPSLEDLATIVLEGSDGAREDLAKHAETCGRCAAEIELVGTWQAAESSLGKLEDRQLERLRERSELPTRPTRSWLPRVASAAAALLALASAAVFFLGGRAPELPERGEGPGVVRGSSVELIEPVGQLDLRPSSWSWSAVEGAAMYRLSILRVDGEIVTVTETPQTSWRSSSDLALISRVTYGWKVEAVARGEVIASSPVEHFTFLEPIP